MAFPNLSAFATATMATVILWIGLEPVAGTPPQVASFGVQEPDIEQVNAPNWLPRRCR